MKRCFLLLALCGTAWLSSCEGEQPQVPDMAPVGDGLMTIGYALVGAAVVLTLGRLVRH